MLQTLPDLLAKKPVNEACLIIPPNAVWADPFGGGCSAGGEAGFLASWLGVSVDVGTGGGGTFGLETSFSGNGDFCFGGCAFNTLGWLNRRKIITKTSNQKYDLRFQSLPV